MQTQPNDPVYPVRQLAATDNQGITLREHFAGLAMQGFLSLPNQIFIDVARNSVCMADELIKALNDSK